MRFDLEQVQKIVGELQEDFHTSAMPKSAYTLKNLVVMPNEHVTMQWLQCVEEMKRRYYGIRRATIQCQILERDIEMLGDCLEAELKQVDLEEASLALEGAFQEFEALYNIYRQFPQRYTREEIEEAQAVYWYNRLTKQAIQDILASGRVGVSNQEGLRQIQVGVRVNEQGQVEIQNGRLLDDKPS